MDRLCGGININLTAREGWTKLGGRVTPNWRKCLKNREWHPCHFVAITSYRFDKWINEN